MRRLEEAERNMRLAEAKIAERDQRISDVERLLDCMAQVRLYKQPPWELGTSHGSQISGRIRRYAFLFCRKRHT